ncbi:hypothetical protein A2160_02240 [Candidatus Beckwithbacteria bacterium RBG_13_42_9]|uniref:Penicillin-binding protein transpeptidase domain-containing protein n=1 Tax=Candidatus Beckwithbacteria bacterium RBG_13_42_9 TaxID=1797457 RepID=A0A1F5E7E3_9BACT|nr:MAG: hypothetical protein A2160_02240 [Candidatus Beckwithbacteria bacterium RBG_13_42_9]
MRSLRIKVIAFAFAVSAFLILVRLFYWQVLAADKLVSMAVTQRESMTTTVSQRGEILAADGFPLVTNQEAYLAYLNRPDLKISPKLAAQNLAPILAPSLDEVVVASETPKAKQQETLVLATERNLEERLNNPETQWLALKHKINSQQKDALGALDIDGLGFSSEQKRVYPEASMAAHLLGFVGSNNNGEDTGYFGLEGYYDLELKGRSGIVREEKDVNNRPILIGNFFDQEKRDGRTLQLNIDRAVQYIIEKQLREAIVRYGAKSGSVIVMDPKSGAILAMAAEPVYEPAFFSKYPGEIYKNPNINELYEPGSTFKVIPMAAGLQEGLVTPETKCDICTEPYKIDKYVIKTWDDKYHSSSSMTDVLIHSDNIGMVFVAQKLGIDRFNEYLKRFGIGKKTGIDLQEEVAGELRLQWSNVDLATAAFGQGIVVTGIQMVQAMGAIANDGKMMTPEVVYRIIGKDKELTIQPRVAGQPIDKRTADTLTAMMVEAVDKGEAKWSKPAGYKIAGKTGTAQIPIAGHYDQDKTIASFVGFAPADNPRFVMLTKLRETTKSPWGSETAAPLFFNIARELFLYWGIPPSN